jgi:hypothetical protein
MGVTVNVNNLSLVHQASNGIAMATVPDVCKTPSPGGPIPIPYPNIARSATLSKGSTTVSADGGNSIAIKGSEFASSNGDEAGTAGGVKSSTNMKEATWISYSFDVKIDGENACRLTDKMFMNHGNTICASGELQMAFLVDTGDPIMDLLCQIFCQTREKGHKQKNKRFNYSQEAKKLSESSTAQKAFKKAAGESAEIALEKSTMVAVKKGALAGTKRAALSAKAIERRVLKEVTKKSVEAAGKGAAKKVAKKIAAKFIPGLNVISTAMDIYDLATAAIDISRAVSEHMKNYDTFRIKPDVSVTTPDGEMKIYDYKFDYEKGADSMPDEQKRLYKEKTGEKPKVVDQESCKGCKKK